MRVDPKSAQPVSLSELLEIVNDAPPSILPTDSNVSRDDIRVHRNRANLLAYLSESPAAYRWKDLDSQKTCLKSLQGYGLTPFELFQVANLAPVTVIELVLCIQEAGSRFDEHTVSEMLEVCTGSMRSELFADGPEADEAVH